MSSEVLCYNKGCGKKFDPDSNNAEDCVHHPGVPVFHDALKGWSCCKRRTTDFSDFLNIPGCTRGHHNREKPAEPVAPQVSSSKPKGDSDKSQEQFSQPEFHFKPLEPRISIPRPSCDEPMIPLPMKVTSSLQKALQKLSIEAKDEDSEEGSRKQTLVCRHKSCNVTHTEGIDETCIYHPGGPIFHEGMKYWSCCQRKTSDFTAFLAQEGCEKGTHEWKVKPLVATTPCRYDWHQTGSVVVISIFAKMAMKENSSIKVNQVSADIDLVFEGGTRDFTLKVELDGVIDPAKSHVTLYGTKVEITLKKADASHWKRLDVPKAVNEDPDEDSKEVVEEPTKEKSVEDIDKNGQGPKDEDDDSDLSGIEDTEFD